MSIQNPFFWVTTLLSESPSDSSGIGRTNVKMWPAEYKKITKLLNVPSILVKTHLPVFNGLLLKAAHKQAALSKYICSIPCPMGTVPLLSHKQEKVPSLPLWCQRPRDLQGPEVFKRFPFILNVYLSIKSSIIAFFPRVRQYVYLKFPHDAKYQTRSKDFSIKLRASSKKPHSVIIVSRLMFKVLIQLQLHHNFGMRTEIFNR